VFLDPDGNWGWRARSKPVSCVAGVLFSAELKPLVFAHAPSESRAAMASDIAGNFDMTTPFPEEAVPTSSRGDSFPGIARAGASN
jgi:hypothetical protein